MPAVGSRQDGARSSAAGDHEDGDDLSGADALLGRLDVGLLDGRDGDLAAERCRYPDFEGPLEPVRLEAAPTARPWSSAEP